MIQSMGGDHMIAAAAKVSVSPEDSLALADPAKVPECAGLIRFLMQHRHGSPFEHSGMTFFIHAPIFVWREWHRHRIGHCLAGDSLVWMESVGPNSGRTIRKRPISAIYQNWKVGVADRVPGRSGRGVVLHECGLWRSTGTSDGKQVHLGYFGTEREALDKRAEWAKSHQTVRTRVLPSCKNLPARVLNEDTQLFEIGRMADVFESGVKELYLLKTEPGHELRSSKDHRILTQDGWATVGELRKGDRVAVVGKRSMFAERQIPPSLRSGIGVWTTMQRKRLIRDEDRCYVCGAKYPRELLVLDHVVPVVSDLLRALDVTNLKPICEPCNRIKTNAEQTLARRGCTAGSKFVRVAETPKRIGEGMTYDIEMEGPHHNFVANGIVVHNSYNEESGRYKTLEPVFYLPPRDRPMIKVENWKPGRPKFLPCDDQAVYDRLCENLKRTYLMAYHAYLDNLSMGIDPGLARDCLPVGIYSSCWVTVNPRSLMAFLSLRTHEPSARAVSYPLYEIEVAARLCEKFLAEGWPLTYKAFQDFGRVAP
jgi:thymidylate synthase ThyX